MQASDPVPSNPLLDSPARPSAVPNGGPAASPASGERKVVTYNGREVQPLNSGEAVAQAQADAVAGLRENIVANQNALERYTDLNLKALEKTLTETEAQVGDFSKVVFKKMDSAGSPAELEAYLDLLTKGNEKIPEKAVVGNKQTTDFFHATALQGNQREDNFRTTIIENIRKLNGAINEAALNKIAQDQAQALNKVEEEKARQQKELDRNRKELEMQTDKEKAIDDLKVAELRRKIALQEQASIEFQKQVDLYKYEFDKLIALYNGSRTFTAIEPKLIWESDGKSYRIEKGQVTLK